MKEHPDSPWQGGAVDSGCNVTVPFIEQAPTSLLPLLFQNGDQGAGGGILPLLLARLREGGRARRDQFIEGLTIFVVRFITDRPRQHDVHAADEKVGFHAAMT